MCGFCLSFFIIPRRSILSQQNLRLTGAGIFFVSGVGLTGFAGIGILFVSGVGLAGFNDVGILFVSGVRLTGFDDVGIFERFTAVANASPVRRI